MSDDEVFALFAGVAAAAIGVGWWWAPLWTVRRMRGWRWGGVAVLVALAGLAGLWAVLRNYADKEVREHGDYVLLFIVWGTAWEAWGLGAMSLLGVSWRDNVIERRNGAALAAACGMLVGTMCVYAGSNMGAGPTVWTTFGPALLGTGALLLAWWVAEMIGAVAEAVTVERDAASGVRLMGVLVAGGLVIGRALAGNWESAGATVRDLWLMGWPALLLAVAGGILQRALRPRVGERRDVSLAGWLPAVAMVGAALLWVLRLGVVR